VPFYAFLSLFLSKNRHLWSFFGAVSCYCFKIIVYLVTISRPFLNFAITQEGGGACREKNRASLKSQLRSHFYSDFNFEKCVRIVILNAIILFLYKLSLDFSEVRYLHVNGRFLPAEEQNRTVMLYHAPLK